MGRITIEESTKQVRVTADGVTLAESGHPVVLSEQGLPDRIYLPRTDVRMDLLEASPTTSTCPYKGEAEYWSLDTGATRVNDVAWSYPAPITASEQIAGLISFYPGKVELYVDGELLP